MDLVTKVVEAEIQAEGGADWLESTEGDAQRPQKRKSEELNTPTAITLDPQTKNTWQKIREYSTTVAELISSAIHQSGTLQPDVLTRIQAASEELFKMTKVVAPETGLSVSVEVDGTSKKKKRDSDEKKKRRRRAVSNPTNLYCHACGTRDTPEWRRGPDGCKSLCNACGLHYAKIVKKEQETNNVPESRPISVSMLLN